ncbi:MAG: hypothetical protein V1806_14015 [Pseudomonadota bacterium]
MAIEQRAAVDAEQMSNIHAAETALVVAEEEAGALQIDQAMQTMLEIGKAAGRVQSAQIFGHVADSIQVSQLRQLKATHKNAGMSWDQTCKMVGISRRTAERYMSLADELGDDFFGHCAQIGLSVRTMDAARQLPEPVRQALAQGQVVDLEAVSKEALTDAIRQLASEHAKEMQGLEEQVKAERKALDKAVGKHIEAADKASQLEQELESLREGLDADEARVLRALHEAERPIAAHMVRIKNTLDLSHRSPAFIARLVSGLEFIRALADYTAQTVLARAEGLEPDEDALGAEARQLNQDLADSDGAAPHPGI